MVEWTTRSRSAGALLAAVASLALRAAPAAEPRLELEVAPGAPFTPGELVRVEVFLHWDAPAVKYVSFGIRSGAGADLWFHPSPQLTALPGVEGFSDRFLDVRRVSAGVGDFGFDETSRPIALPEGRVRLGTALVDIVAGAEREVVVEVGACACRREGSIDPPVVDAGGLVQIEPAGASARIPIGDQDFVRGDANIDGRIDIGDATRTAEAIFLIASPPHCPDALDANDDGALDVSDPVRLLSYLFLGGPPPPAPFPGSGPDGTADLLHCRRRP